MALEWRELLQLSIVLMVVPTQYFISNWSGSTETSRSAALDQLFADVRAFSDDWLSADSWSQWMDDVGSGKVSRPNPGSDKDESPALEVLEYRAMKSSGYFGTDASPRSPRDPHVKYRVGQVIRHKKWGYLGVIVGWDTKAHAPEGWLETMHGSNDHWRSQPNYVVLVDTRYREHAQETYVVQDNIEVVKHTRVKHPKVEDYFITFDGSQYLPRPWLRYLYPDD